MAPRRTTLFPVVGGAGLRLARSTTLLPIDGGGLDMARRMTFVPVDGGGGLGMVPRSTSFSWWAAALGSAGRAGVRICR
jgi:hypothetical protein